MVIFSSAKYLDRRQKEESACLSKYLALENLITSSYSSSFRSMTAWRIFPQLVNYKAFCFSDSGSAVDALRYRYISPHQGAPVEGASLQDNICCCEASRQQKLQWFPIIIKWDENTQALLSPSLLDDPPAGAKPRHRICCSYLLQKIYSCSCHTISTKAEGKLSFWCPRRETPRGSCGRSPGCTFSQM